jgi:hypothetical protein
MLAFCFKAIARKIFSCRIYRLFLSVVMACLILHSSFSQEINAYKSIASGNFSNALIWNIWDGTSWIPAAVKPDQTNDVYIDQTHLVTLTGNEVVKSIFINAETSAGQKLNINGFQLEIYGSLNAFSGAAPGIASGTWNSQNWIGNSLTSRIIFRGNSRTIINLGSWSGFSTNSRYSVIFDPGDGVELTIEEAFKSLSFTIRSGTVIQKLDLTVIPADCPTFSFNNETTVYGAGPFGEFIIESGATLISDCNSDILFRSGSISALNFDLQNGGTLILEGDAPRIEAANFQINGKVIYRGGTTSKTYLSSSYVDAATPSSVRNLELQSSQSLTLPSNLTLLGDMEQSGTGNFIATGTTLTLLGGSDQEIIGFPLVVRDLVLNKSGGVFYPKGNLTVQRNLTLTQGSIDLEGNNLLINTGLSGSLSYTGGTWRNLGQFTYFGIPTNLNGTNSTFPFEDTQNGGIRKVQLLGTSAGGNLTINFTEYEGAEYNSDFDDNDGIEILYRLFSYFNFTGLNPSSNLLELRISADDLIVDNVDDLRIVGTGYAAPGNHLSGLDPVELWARRELTFDELAGVNFTVGSYRTLSILPVTWLEVNSESASDGNRITWKLAKEENNLLFEVHRSLNPQQDEWEKVGVVNSLGDTDSPREYQLTDFSASKFRDYYYRIRQVDFSGRWSWSSLTKVSFPKDMIPMDRLVIYPNPYESGNLNLILPDFIDQTKAELTLQDSQGKIIFQSKFSESNLSNLATNLAPGLYLVRVISEGIELNGKLVRR